MAEIQKVLFKTSWSSYLTFFAFGRRQDRFIFWIPWLFPKEIVQTYFFYLRWPFEGQEWNFTLYSVENYIKIFGHLSLQDGPDWQIIDHFNHKSLLISALILYIDIIISIDFTHRYYSEILYWLYYRITGWLPSTSQSKIGLYLVFQWAHLWVFSSR